MFIGKVLQLYTMTLEAELQRLGSAKGDLARHVQMSKIHKGHPIRTHRVEVFEQVRDHKHEVKGTKSLTVNQIEFATLLAQVLTFGFTKLSVLLFYKRFITHLAP